MNKRPVAMEATLNHQSVDTAFIRGEKNYTSLRWFEFPSMKKKRDYRIHVDPWLFNL